MNCPATVVRSDYNPYIYDLKVINDFDGNDRQAPKTYVILLNLYLKKKTCVYEKTNRNVSLGRLLRTDPSTIYLESTQSV